MEYKLITPKYQRYKLRIRCKYHPIYKRALKVNFTPLFKDFLSSRLTKFLQNFILSIFGEPGTGKVVCHIQSTPDSLMLAGA